MRDAPICNDALEVEASAFATWRAARSASSSRPGSSISSPRRATTRAAVAAAAARLLRCAFRPVASISIASELDGLRRVVDLFAVLAHARFRRSRRRARDCGSGARRIARCALARNKPRQQRPRQSSRAVVRPLGSTERLRHDGAGAGAIRIDVASRWPGALRRRDRRRPSAALAPVSRPRGREIPASGRAAVRAVPWRRAMRPGAVAAHRASAPCDAVARAAIAAPSARRDPALGRDRLAGAAPDGERRRPARRCSSLARALARRTIRRCALHVRRARNAARGARPAGTPDAAPARWFGDCGASCRTTMRRRRAAPRPISAQRRRRGDVRGAGAGRARPCRRRPARDVSFRDHFRARWRELAHSIDALARIGSRRRRLAPPHDGRRSAARVGLRRARTRRVGAYTIASRSTTKITSRLCDRRADRMEFPARRPFRAALLGARDRRGTRAELRITRLAALFDPCVAFRVAVREAADA